jgi:2-desacetyl-2-hydroxyethyl bacteriochlorophyllide A dehydrogenase
MKAAVFYGAQTHGEIARMKIEKVPDPTPAQGEVLIRVAACGLCRTDLEYLKGEGTPPKAPPLILGHEPSGTIVDLGEGVNGFSVGQRVLVATPIPCQHCETCRRGFENRCPHMSIVGATRDGAFAEYLATPASSVFALPDDLPLEESAIITDAVATSYHALYNQAQLQPGDTIAIFGASGGLGLICVQLAAATGATVIGVGRKQWKLDQAREFGATAVLGTEEVDKVDAAIRRMTGGGVDIAIDATAVPSMIENAIRSTRPGGKTVVLGFGYQKLQIGVNQIMWLERTIVGSRNYRPVDMPRVLELVRKGVIDLSKMVSHRFGLDEINEAYLQLDRGEMLRGIVLP